eukprot:s1218_g3.t1
MAAQQLERLPADGADLGRRCGLSGMTDGLDEHLLDVGHSAGTGALRSYSTHACRPILWWAPTCGRSITDGRSSHPPRVEGRGRLLLLLIFLHRCLLSAATVIALSNEAPRPVRRRYPRSTATAAAAAVSSATLFSYYAKPSFRSVVLNVT